MLARIRALYVGAKETCRKIHSLPVSSVLSVFVTGSVGHGTVPGTGRQFWVNSIQPSG